MKEPRDCDTGRREFIRRGAIAGGLAWTAPVIVTSLTSVAGAQGTPAPDDGPTTTTEPSEAAAPARTGPPPPAAAPARTEPTFTG